ncbi:hypothetical protein [Kitasatospora sp. NPDC088783]|uniref:hypothetical protein n=1 Tax=Kitasatospora sp. NPDC088783 TaxID=3364077 RepID=UPI003803A1D1
MTDRHARALRNRDISETFVSHLTERESLLRANHRWLLPMLDRMCAGLPVAPAHRKPVNLPRRAQEDMIDIASHVGILRMWARRGRVTYDLHPDLASELYRSTSDELPGSIFERMPHINPLVVLPEPWPVQYKDVRGQVRGFYVFGFNDEPTQATFTDEEVDGLGLLFVIDLLDPQTWEVHSQTYMRMNIPTGRKRFTVQEAADFAADRAEAVWGRQRDPDAVLGLFEEVLRPALSVLVYLCCDNRDLAEPPVAAPVRKRRRPVRERDPFFVEVGWRIGPKLHAARRAAGRVRDGDGLPSGVQHAPHQKSGHFRRFRIGKGRTGSTIRWVMPYWVRLDLLPEDTDPITTVVPVETQRRDPLRRRGLGAPRRGARRPSRSAHRDAGVTTGK